MRLQENILRRIQLCIKEVYSLTLSINTGDSEYISVTLWNKNVDIIASAHIRGINKITYKEIVEQVLVKLKSNYKVRNETAKSLA